MSFTTAKFEGIRAGSNPIKVDFITAYTENSAKVSYSLLVNGGSSESHTDLNGPGSSVSVNFNGLLGEFTMYADHSIGFNGSLTWADMSAVVINTIIAIK